MESNNEMHQLETSEIELPVSKTKTSKQIKVIIILLIILSLIGVIFIVKFFSYEETVCNPLACERES